MGKECRNAVKGPSHSFGRVFSRFASPNFYSFLTLLTGLFTAIAIFSGQFPLAIIFLFLSGFFDFIDGAVARYSKKTSPLGALYDSVIDKITESVMYIAMALHSHFLFLPASLAIFFFLLSSYISKHSAALGAKSSGGLLERKERLFLIALAIAFMAFSPNYSALTLYLIAFLSGLTGLQRLLRTKKALEK